MLDSVYQGRKQDARGESVHKGDIPPVCEGKPVGSYQGSHLSLTSESPRVASSFPGKYIQGSLLTVDSSGPSAEDEDEGQRY